MADTVTTQTIADTSGVKFVAKLTNFSDGTGETLVKKVDASELTFMSEDGNRSISRVYYSINTSDRKSGVEILWAGSGDSAANATIGFFSGRGFHDYFADGNSIPYNATLTANTSPAGDILFSTKGFVAGDNYTIILEIR